MLQVPPGPPGQVGQPGQAGRSRDGQAPQLTKALEDALKTQKTSWDTTNLENSFDYFGRTMHEVLKAQQKTTQNLEEQFKRANETQEFQTEAMQDSEIPGFACCSNRKNSCRGYRSHSYNKVFGYDDQFRNS